jgi:hypothetical protein
MQYDQLIQLYFERSNALQWYWTIYVIVIGGLLAFSSQRKQSDLLTTALVSVLYSFFAYKNLDAIYDVTIQRHATLKAIKEMPLTASDAANMTRVRREIEPTLIPPAYDGVRTFHVTSDVLTIAALWSMELRRRRKAVLGDQRSK